jgi:hypothetical protein
MPDITMCNGVGCEIKEICYRYKATPSEFMQSYFFTTPNKGLNYCDYYWKFEIE